MFNINNMSSSYNTNSTISKKHNNPIPNWLHAKFLLWGYDPITNDEYLLGETTDKRIAQRWVKETKRDHYTRIIVEFPGSYYTTAHELRWCDTCANKEPIFTCKYEENDLLPF